MQLFLSGISLTVTCTCCTVYMQGTELFENPNFSTHWLCRWLAQPQKAGNSNDALTWMCSVRHLWLMPGRSYSAQKLQWHFLTVHSSSPILLVCSVCFYIHHFKNTFSSYLCSKSLTHGMRRWLSKRLYLALLEEIKLFWTFERFAELFKKQKERWMPDLNIFLLYKRWFSEEMALWPNCFKVRCPC